MKLISKNKMKIKNKLKQNNIQKSLIKIKKKIKKIFKFKNKLIKFWKKKEEKIEKNYKMSFVLKKIMLIMTKLLRKIIQNEVIF